MSQEVAVFTIGGQEIKLGPLPLWSLERCWDSIEALATVGTKPFIRFRQHCDIIAAGMALEDPSTTAETLQRRCSWDEGQGLAAGIVQLLRISGFRAEPQEEPEQGEAKAAALTETGQESSPNSLPGELKADVGTV